MIDFYLSDFLNVARPVFRPARDHIFAKWLPKTRATSFLWSKYRARSIMHGFDIYLGMKILRKVLIFCEIVPLLFLECSFGVVKSGFLECSISRPIPNRSQTNPKPILARFYVLNPNWVRLVNDESILHFIIIGGKDFKYVSTFEAP